MEISGRYRLVFFCRGKLADSYRLPDAYFEEETVKAMAATMYAAGSDTIVTSITIFFLAMLANPEAQKQAQREIDQVLGQGQLPDFKDEDALP